MPTILIDLIVAAVGAASFEGAGTLDAGTVGGATWAAAATGHASMVPAINNADRCARRLKFCDATLFIPQN